MEKKPDPDAIRLMASDFVIIGGGQAGIPLAHALAQAGKSTVLVERKNLGGSCINFGCTPTKAAIASAKLAFDSKRASEFGLRIPEVQIDFSGVLGQARSISEASRKSLEQGFENVPNLRLIRSHAKLIERDATGIFRIETKSEELLAKEVIINVGSRTFFPRISGLNQPQVIHADNWLDQTDLPEHLVILGSGYIGFEMGQFYRRMGAQVTLLEGGPQVLKNEDADVAENLESYLKAEGISFLKNIQVNEFKYESGGWKIQLKDSVVEGSHVFVATGRKPNTDDLGLEKIGVRVDHKGYVLHDEKLSTNVPGVWVAGDARGGPLFTHTAWDDFRILQSQILGDGSRTLHRIVPYAIFTDPELGRVGITEKQARTQRMDIAVAHFPFSENSKANELRETKGFIKLIADPKHDQLLGAAVVGAHASETVQLYVTLMNANAPYSVIRDAIYIHPTLAEAAQSAVSLLPTSSARKAA